MTSIDKIELARFDAASATWWDKRGEARWLHKYNPVRVAYIADAACSHFGLRRNEPPSLAGLRILDIGCGGGVLCEPLARLGASVVGSDPAGRAVAIASQHAADEGLAIDYRCASAEELADAGEQFSIVLAMEVIEHVADANAFLGRCVELIAPGGLLILSTINRTVKSWAYAIVAGEYVLGLLPRGTHQWRRFVTPQEVGRAVARHGLRVANVSGVGMSLMSGDLRLSRSAAVNYLLTAEHGHRAQRPRRHGA